MSATFAPPSQFVFPNDQPVVSLDAKAAFEGLTKSEQLYAHYLSKASFYGGLIVLLQTSPESPQIFRLIHRINSAQDTASLKEAAIKAGLSEDEFQAFLIYCSGVYTNMGNYKGFGDSKIIPNLAPEKFEALVKASTAWTKDFARMADIWNSCKDALYSLSDKEKQLGLGKKGITKYFSANCDEKDSDLINKYFKSKQVEGYMNRALKKEVDGKTLFEIRHAAVETMVLGKDDFEGAEFILSAGDYNQLLALVNENLDEAKKHAANENEKMMLDNYIKSFAKGSLDAHKDGSRYWIKNKGPAVETYIGFIETYRDPVGMRAEFEGFVAMVNKAQSAKFQELVNQAENFLPRLPWPKEFEKDVFLRPDFTSLDVLSFAGSGIPAGINIPNYDEIRQSEGFKNVNLGNVISSSYKADKKSPFVTQEDHELLEKYRVSSFEVQVGLHELLGHGSGKLLQHKPDGTFNYPTDLINPETGKAVDKWYEPGETYDSKFTSLGSAYEECRAECVGLYLSCDKEVLKIFGQEANASDIVYVNWFSLCHAAIRGLEMFSPAAEEWKQAHSQARFAILRVLLEAGEGFVSVKEITGDDGKPDLLLTMDRNKLESVGKPAIGAFLRKLQVYKSLGDISNARTMFDGYSSVTDDDKSMPWATWRDIVLARKQPRKMLVQANTQIKDEKLVLTEYEPTHEGMIKSWVDRFPGDEYQKVDAILEKLYEEDKPYF